MKKLLTFLLISFLVQGQFQYLFAQSDLIPNKENPYDKTITPNKPIPIENNAQIQSIRVNPKNPNVGFTEDLGVKNPYYNPNSTVHPIGVNPVGSDEYFKSKYANPQAGSQLFDNPAAVQESLDENRRDEIKRYMLIGFCFIGVFLLVYLCFRISLSLKRQNKLKQLERLGNLKQSGILSQEEIEIEKNKILSN